MSLAEYFPVLAKLRPEEQRRLLDAAVLRRVPKGTLLHNGSEDCLGLLVLREGQLRAFICSDEGREITVYRLFERDVCLFSASCMMNSIQFDITISAEKETEFWILPPQLYKELMEQSAPLANYTGRLMAERFNEVMWLIEQILWKSFDRRLAAFLLEESVLEESPSLTITHELIAGHLGTAREVVTRMLKYFQTEAMVTLSRGLVVITDEKRLRALAEK